MLKYFFKSPQLQLGLIHSLGGAGGTLLAQCISAMKNVFLLSECNPLSAHLFDYNLNPYIQLQNWHPKLYAVVKKKFDKTQLCDPKSFCHFLKLLCRYLHQNKQHLIVRDYNYIDYIGLPYIPFPPMYSNLMFAIKEAFTTCQVVLVRNPLAQYNSLRSHTITKNILTPKKFIEGYLKFLGDFSDCYWLKYEDIVADPTHYIAATCGVLQIPFSEEFIHEFYKKTAVTGNFNRINQKMITLSNTQLIEDSWTEDFKTHPQFNLLMSQLGYES